ncbi:MAG: hypothetical protein JSS42_01040 [Proteobacteria bacterium]|nr:hypothetical protein [Pseudomonadota bacterium]
MMPSLRLAVCATGLMIGPGGAAFAHHSTAAYDLDHPTTMAGTVKQVNWTNPHITFVVEKDAKEGEQPVTWVFEVSSPGVLTRSGWTKRSLQPGDHAVFLYKPLRDGTAGGYLTAATLQNGQKLSYSLTPVDEDAGK